MWLVGVPAALGVVSTFALNGEVQAVRREVRDGMYHPVAYVLAHTNKTNGWIGPFANEPGDINGHGLWDPLNMLRSLFMHMEAHGDPALTKRVAKAAVAHLTQEHTLCAGLCMCCAGGGAPGARAKDVKWSLYVCVVVRMCMHA